MGGSNINGTDFLKNFRGRLDVEGIDAQLACTVRERRELIATPSGPFSINRNHEQERSACLRGAADYHQVFGQGGNEIFCAIQTHGFLTG